jgi:signal transduction histidine kinase
VFADFVREELRARKVDLFVKLEEGLPLLRLDAGQIRQALLNLTRNAAESMPGGGAIRIEARLSAESRGAGEQRSRGEGGNAPWHPSSPVPLPHVEITVTDTGVGIPAGELEQVFEPFFTNKEGGTGLGLPISRQIILDHGGTLRCESVPGVGTTFRLTLPIPEEEHRR